ncbi:MAG: YidC/Oxa1 family membrane protein insertase, partial [Treponema sp.]|nr:YidC/Oxa1 family membrane protein insertase [Treponema sp.]
MPNILYTIIIYPLVQIIEFVFVFSQKIFKEPGISVIFISGAVSVLCLPLYNVAEAWQDYERALQKKFRPKINAIKAVFSGDERFLILSTYYRQNHYHPVFALRSTFSLAIQVPFFIAAYSYLSGLEALKGASFLFISDMGVPDALFSLGGGVTLNLLPLIMTAVNCAAGAVYTRGFPLKDKVQLYGMAAVFLLLLYNSPSGLVIYWTTNNLFSLFKNIYHKISYGYKTHILAACISALCLFMVYFILFLHKGEQQQRHIIALFSIILAIVPWALIAKTKAKSASRPPVLKNHSKSVSSRETVLFMLSAAALWVLAGLWIPSTLIVSSPDEFSYIDSYASPLFFIANTALQAFGLFVFWPLCLFFLFSGGRASSGMKKLFTFLAFLLFTGALCNTFGFPGNYGLISQSLQFANTVDHPRPELLLNMAVLCFAALAAAFLFSKKLYAFLFPFPAIIMAALLVLASVNLISIQKAYASLSTIHPGNGQKLAEARPLFTLSRTGKNTVIIMLDRASSSFFPFILEEDPALLDEYSGFVYYPNTVSFNGYTSAGAPPIFGGYEYTPEAMNKRDGEPMVQKHNEALLLLPRIFSEAGYQVTVTDPPYPNYSNKNDLGIYDSIPNVKAYITDSKYTALWLEEHNLRLPSMGDILRRDILWYSLLRISPPVIRRAIYQRGDWCSSIPGQKLTGFLNGYAVLDYLPALT